ncbi:tRNA (adenosine(37)-N6)-threonylcarbamoyltransferase complex ATPase subunit type 1 TsaE [Candidatus Parcubacteria bacterium]|jgi:tRNA threonylcarbamoyladenosine biosynthesis protein TsaE|nr:MAG: tRNA (adenosine(37)-N6)-threonylcarbamoyltransferase complex ATPase subunit type 1 TsaE [Candidatus Parcubacteria bacterium]
MQKVFNLKTPRELKLAARALLAQKPKVIALSGPLGAGKTVLTQAIAEFLGIKQVPTSPTFVIEQIYQVPGLKKYRFLVHVDCYRLKSKNEIPALDLEYWLNQNHTLVIIEWAEKIKVWLKKFQPLWVRIDLRPRGRRIYFNNRAPV